MHSTQQHKEYASVLDQMAGSSTSPVSEPIQRYTRFSSGTCCLLMTQQLWPTPWRNSSHWWIASHRPKDFGLTISLKKTKVLGQDTEALPVITIDDYELDAVCQFIYLGFIITDNLSLDAEIDKMIGKHRQLSPGSRLECGQAPSCLRRQILQSTLSVLPAHCCMTARHDICHSETWLRMPGRREGSTHSTWEASVVPWEYPGGTK